MLVRPYRSKHGFLIDQLATRVRSRAALCTPFRAPGDFVNDQNRIDNRGKQRHGDGGGLPNGRHAHGRLIGQFSGFLPGNLTPHRWQC